jgi:DNA-binding transcriptional LysR family regulator
MDLRQLRYLVAVADEGHVTRAAERLGIQQPPLSRQILTLEQDVGAKLFLRHAKGVTLTEAGRALVEEARAILARAEGAAEVARRAARGETGRLAVGYTSSAAFNPMVFSQIRAFRRDRPAVQLALHEDGTPDLIKALREERLDAAFLRSAVEAGADLTVDALADEPMVAVVPTDHALAGQREVALAALASETFVLYRRPTGPGLYDAVIAACRAAGFSPVIGQEAPRMASTISLVAAGLGVSLAPASMRRMHMEGVAYLDVSGAPQLVAPLLLAVRRANRSPLAELFRRTILTARDRA